VNGRKVKHKGVSDHAMMSCRSSRGIAQFVDDSNKNCVHEGSAARLNARNAC
jgi:hypothetical protein